MRPAPRLFVLLAFCALVGAALAACTNSSGSTEEFCDQVRKVPALESVLARFSESDPDLLADRIEKAREAYDDLGESAPSDIDAETDEVVSLVNDTLDAVEQNPTDPAKAADQLRKAMADHPNIDDDRAKVTAYAKTECDVQLDATLTDGGTSSTTPSTTAPAATTTTSADGSATTTTGG